MQTVIKRRSLTFQAIRLKGEVGGKLLLVGPVRMLSC